MVMVQPGWSFCICPGAAVSAQRLTVPCPPAPEPPPTRRTRLFRRTSQPSLPSPRHRSGQGSLRTGRGPGSGVAVTPVVNEVTQQAGQLVPAQRINVHCRGCSKGAHRALWRTLPRRGLCKRFGKTRPDSTLSRASSQASRWRHRHLPHCRTPSAPESPPVGTPSGRHRKRSESGRIVVITTDVAPMSRCIFIISASPPGARRGSAGRKCGCPPPRPGRTARPAPPAPPSRTPGSGRQSGRRRRRTWFPV